MLYMNGRKRTPDIKASTDSFSKLLLPASIRRALALAGYRTPSPIQELCVPIARTGADLIIQAKSGTGKTLVFTLPCLERLDGKIKEPQGLILAPTREIALQIEREISKISNNIPYPYMTSGVFTGGVPVNDDRHRLKRPCQIIVGTPGRLVWLCQNNLINLDHIRIFVMDEADQLFAESMSEAVQFIISKLPDSRQNIACSATFTESNIKGLEEIMENPQKIFLNFENGSLLGVKQTYRLIDTSNSRRNIFESKLAMLIDVLASVSFYQAIVFCNKKDEAEKIVQQLEEIGFPSIYTSGSRSQEDRNEAIDMMRGFRTRVIVSTDLVSRGIDLEHVNLICNLDLPSDQATYQHRVGRTGRFGTFGLCVSLVAPDELPKLKSYIEHNKGVLIPLPDHVPEEWYTYSLQKAAEREAFAELLTAPTMTPDPLRHFENDDYHGILTPEEFENWKHTITARHPVWENCDPYEMGIKKFREMKMSSPVSSAMSGKIVAGMTGGHSSSCGSGLDKKYKSKSSKLLKLPSTLSFASTTSIVYSEEEEIGVDDNDVDDDLTASDMSDMSIHDNFESEKKKSPRLKKITHESDDTHLCNRKSNQLENKHSSVSNKKNNSNLNIAVRESRNEVGNTLITDYDNWVKAYQKWQEGYTHWYLQYQNWYEEYGKHNSCS